MVPSNLKLVEALALCDEKDLGELVQTLECQVRWAPPKKSVLISIFEVERKNL
jgi:hypothetical protein